jgi:hypothetical protein
MKPRQKPEERKRGSELRKASLAGWHMHTSLQPTFWGELLRRDPLRVRRVGSNGGDVLADPHDGAKARLAKDVNLPRPQRRG